jgi:hypothetical protein
MGLLGEQAVAEQLQPLFADGYRIFHDVPGDGKWNIDHVVVGPAGVFAIETKYRTKQPGKASERDHEAIFDGNKIQFPSGYDAEAPEQARRNARWLAKDAFQSNWRACDGPAGGGVAGLVGDAQSQFGRESV